MVVGSENYDWQELQKVCIHCAVVVATLLWRVATFFFLIQHNHHYNPPVVVWNSVGTTIL